MVQCAVRCVYRAVCSAQCVPCSVRRSVRCTCEVHSVQCAVQYTPPGAARGAEEEELVRREEDSGPQGGGSLNPNTAKIRLHFSDQLQCVQSEQIMPRQI